MDSKSQVFWNTCKCRDMILRFSNPNSDIDVLRKIIKYFFTTFVFIKYLCINFFLIFLCRKLLSFFVLKTKTHPTPTNENGKVEKWQRKQRFTKLYSPFSYHLGTWFKYITKSRKKILFLNHTQTMRNVCKSCSKNTSSIRLIRETLHFKVLIA